MKKYLLTIIISLFYNSVFAIVKATINSNNINANEVITLTIELPDSNVQPNLAPLNQDFQIVGRASSSQTSIINGSVSSQHNLSINLAPKRAGKITIPALMLGNDHTSPFNIVVNSLGNSSNTNPTTPTIPDKALLLKTSVDKTSGYVGVPISLTLKLFYAVNISNVTLEQFSIDGAHTDTNSKSKQYQTTENGHPYMVVQQTFIVTPDSVGKITIPAIHANGRIDNNPNNILFINSGQPFSVQSQPISLNIKEIPPQVDPTKWLPANNVVVSENWSNTSNQVSVGDPITRTITISATGVDASVIPELIFDKVESVNIYPEKSQKNTNTQANQPVGSKTFKVVYIPNKDGEVKFPAIKINWWNLNTDKESQIVIPEKSFNVTGAIVRQSNKTKKIDSSSQNNSDEVANQANYKTYLIFMASLALIVFGFSYVYRIRRSKNDKNLSNEQSTPQPKQNKNIMITNIQLACNNKNILELNQALLEWAKIKYKHKIYSINQIKILSTNDELSLLIEQLLLALYNNGNFDKFEEIKLQINNLEQLANDVVKKDFNLPKLYPDID